MPQNIFKIQGTAFDDFKHNPNKDTKEFAEKFFDLILEKYAYHKKGIGFLDWLNDEQNIRNIIQNRINKYKDAFLKGDFDIKREALISMDIEINYILNNRNKFKKSWKFTWSIPPWKIIEPKTFPEEINTTRLFSESIKAHKARYDVERDWMKGQPTQLKKMDNLIIKKQKLTKEQKTIPEKGSFKRLKELHEKRRKDLNVSLKKTKLD